MNDTERDLRELFESKARDAGGAPPVTREVLRRGRRRQAGTVAVAGVTALTVAAVAAVSLQALHRADVSVPGGSNGNPAFTATIQNFTLTVPKGWTLIDQWPLGSSMAVDSTSTKFSCVGTPIEAGSGKNTSSGSSSSDCSDQQVQNPDPPTIPQGGLPMLTLSNDDPGLGGSVCNPGGSLPESSATLYIGLDYGATRNAGWENDILPGPQPLVNVVEGDLPVEQMPCGPGGYSWFQTGGMPYIAWAGFGSEVSDADQQTIIDTFNGMQVGDGEITPPESRVPAYVLTGGSSSGSPWTIEVAPSKQNVTMMIQTPGGNASGFGDFDVPSRPIEGGTIGTVSFGAVTFDAERVEARPDDGTDPVPASILHLPDTLGAPFDAFVVDSGQGALVAIGPEGDLGSAATGVYVTPEAAPTAKDVQSDLRNAYVAAKTYYTDGNTFEGFDPQVARSFGTSRQFNESAQATAGEVSIRDVAADHILFAEATATGDVLCIAENDAGRTTYGAVDAQTVDECVGGEASWGQAVPAATPTAVEDPAAPPEVEGRIVATGRSWALGVSEDGPKYCVNLSVIPAGADTASGASWCSQQPPPPSPVLILSNAEATYAILVVLVPRDVATVDVTKSGPYPGEQVGRGTAPPPFGAEDLVVIAVDPDAGGGGTARLRFVDRAGADMYHPLDVSW